MRSPEHDARKKLSDKDVRRIRSLFEDGTTYTDIAEMFNIHWHHAYKICKRMRRKDVD